MIRARSSLLALALFGCGSKGETIVCGLGTVAKEGACVPASDGCGPGTVDVAGRCQPVPPDRICGPGTHEESGICLPDPKGDPMLGPTSWSKNVRVGAADPAVRDPALAVDEQGRIFVAFSRHSDVEVWMSGDRERFSRVFSTAPSDVVPPLPGFPDQAFRPSIAVDARGRVAVAWSVFSFSSPIEIRAAVSQDGTTFVSALVATSTGFVSPAVRLGREPGGGVAAVWVDQEAVTRAETSTATGNFAPPSVLGRLALLDMTFGAWIEVESPLNFDRAGRPFVLSLLSNFDGFAGMSNASQVVFPAAPHPALVFTATLAETRHYAFDARAALDADASGRFRLLFSSAISRHVSIFEVRSDDGVVWSTPAAAFSDPSGPSANAPALTSDAGGRAYALWSDNRTGGWLTYAAVAEPGGDFGAAERVSEVEGLDVIGGPAPGLATAVAVQGGMRYAVWSDPRGGIYFSTAPVP